MSELNTHDIEMKNIFEVYQNNLNEYEDLLKQNVINLDFENVELVSNSLELCMKEYYNKSSIKHIECLSKQYENFDEMFEKALNNPKYSNMIDTIDKFGMPAEKLFFFICVATTQEEPNPDMCTTLKNEVRNLMLEIHNKIVNTNSK